jgi:hypothetical protein
VASLTEYVVAVQHLIASLLYFERVKVSVSKVGKAHSQSLQHKVSVRCLNDSLVNNIDRNEFEKLTDKG